MDVREGNGPRGSETRGRASSYGKPDGRNRDTEPGERGALDRHLTPDEIERVALAGPGEDPGPAAHVRACGTCRRQVALLRTLDVHLKGLPYLSASPGFTERVMARVQLPVPWHRKVRAAVRRRWAVAAAGLAAAGIALGGPAYWLFGRQGLPPSPSALLAFVLEGAQALALRAAIAAGRVVYDLGLVDLIGTLGERLAPAHAAAAMALLSLLGLGAAWTMKRLVESTPAPVGRAARG